MCQVKVVHFSVDGLLMNVNLMKLHSPPSRMHDVWMPTRAHMQASMQVFRVKVHTRDPIPCVIDSPGVMSRSATRCDTCQVPILSAQIEIQAAICQGVICVLF